MHNIVCRNNDNSIKEFSSWKLVPPNLKTRKQWLRARRRVPKDATPVAHVVYPQIIVESDVSGFDMLILDQWDGGAVATTSPTPLFDRSQTVSYSPSSRTEAYWEFEDIFFRHARKDCWIRKTDLRSGEERSSWFTENESAFLIPFHQRNLLSEELVRKHINQKQIVGVKGSDLTRFVVIDLDYHGRDPVVFEKQAEALLDRFHGTERWHFQVGRHDVNGLQLVNVFDEPRKLAVVQKELRSILIDLDQKRPDLAADAKSAGMKTLAELEIYPTQPRPSNGQSLDTPDNGNGVRLPLCRNRVMLLDKPLSLMMHRGSEVQDVEAYIAWLQNKRRQYMPKEKVLDYIHYYARPTSAPFGKPQKIAAESNVNEIAGGRWKGSLFRRLHDFWIGGNANGRPLNEHLTVLARLAFLYGYSQAEIEAGLMHFVRELPPSAAACSSRLLKNEFRRIEAVVGDTAKHVQGNAHQHDSDRSSRTLSAALASRPGFDPLNKSTWTAPTEKIDVTPNWTDEQRRRLCAFLRRPLFVTDDDLIMRFVNGIVNLTLKKEQEGNGWGKEFLLAWMKDHFPDIRCAKDEKRHRILKCLQEERVIQIVALGRPGMFATHWTLGETAKSALGVTESDDGIETVYSLTQERPSPSLNTSIIYGSLFSEEDLIEAGIVLSPSVSSSDR